MVKEIESLMDNYVNWLKDKTHLKELNGNWVEISTPHLDRNNDYLQIYVRSEEGEYTLTDDGYILRDLEISGCPIDSDKRKQLLSVSLNGFGVDIKNGELVVRATPHDFASKKHNLIQAMLTVNDMFFLASPTVLSLFKEDVEAWLELQDIPIVSDIKLTGESKFDHFFDFAIPGSKNKPERILKTINHPNKASAERMVFSWIDTNKVRRKQSVGVAILNDSDRKVNSPVLTALNNYQIKTLLWSQRDQFVDELRM